MSHRLLAALPCLALTLGACADPATLPATSSASTASAPGNAAGSASEAPLPPGKPRAGSPSRQGSVLARSVDGRRLYVADEDAASLHVVSVEGAPKPLASVSRPGCDPTDAACKGIPAQVLALDGYVLASVRDPGLVVLFAEDPAKGLVEVARTPVTPDAWGLAVTADERALLVTSPLHHTLTKLRLATLTVEWTLDVAAEPRGIAIPSSGDRAYVSHVRGTTLTRVDGLGATPSKKELELDVAKQRTEGGLGYALVLSPDEQRLFVARTVPWRASRPQVDVIALSPRAGGERDAVLGEPNGQWWARPAYVAARGMVYRASKGALLVASEGTDELVELDPSAVAPGALAVRRYDLGGPRGQDHQTRCGAPSGVALSADEKMAWVFCRSSAALASVTLDAPARSGVEGDVLALPGPAPIPAEVRAGRQLFYDARDPFISSWASCATCHPDGRSDGVVWNHVVSGYGDWLNAPGPPANEPNDGDFDVALKTRILVGRARTTGFIGMHAEAKGLEQHLLATFARHGGADLTYQVRRAKALVSFFSRPDPLGTSPRHRRPLSAEEASGKKLWEAQGCAGCHDPAQGYTNGRVERLAALPALPGGDVHPKAGELLVPSLLLVREAGPYFHDGSAKSLPIALDVHFDRLQRTRLAAAERDALVAWLSTVGLVSEGPAREPVPQVLAAFDLRGTVTPAKPLAGPARDLLQGIPTQESPEPAAADWKSADPIASVKLPKGCDLRRVREWVQLRCTLDWTRGGDVDLPPKGLRFGKRFDGLELTVPVRKGDARSAPIGRVVEWGKYGNWEAEGIVFSESWAQDQPGPEVVVLSEPEVQRLKLRDLLDRGRGWL